MNNPMWICMAGEVIYIFYSYLFGFLFFFVDRVDKGQKIKNTMWVCMAGEVVYTLYSCVFVLYIFR